MSNDSGKMPDTAVILVGGFGTRLSEETTDIPKPLVEISGRPILWHIMKIYSHFGVRKFILCAGYKQQLIKNYFERLYVSESDVEFSTATGSIKVLQPSSVDWQVSVVDTGLRAQTGERLRKVSHLLPPRFFLTYGDGLANVNLNDLAADHADSGRLATVTAVQPAGRFGALDIDGSTVTGFTEKPPGDRNWVNGGFFVFDKQCLRFMEQGNVTLEDGLLVPLAQAGELNAHKHSNFWQPMDTMRDKHLLNDLWDAEYCPWRVWNV